MFDKPIDKLGGMLKGLFQERALSTRERDEFEAEIRFSASRAGFNQAHVNEHGLRVFTRDMDGARVTMPQKKDLRRRDRIGLHGFDGYL